MREILTIGELKAAIRDAESQGLTDQHAVRIQDDEGGDILEVQRVSLGRSGFKLQGGEPIRPYSAYYLPQAYLPLWVAKPVSVLRDWLMAAFNPRPSWSDDDQREARR